MSPQVKEHSEVSLLQRFCKPLYNGNYHGHNGRMAMGTMVQWANGLGTIYNYGYIWSDLTKEVVR